MVSKAIVLETIKRMYDSGIEDSVVVATLRDIGLGDEEIREYITEVKGAAPAALAGPMPSAVPVEEHEAIAARTAEKVREHLAAEHEERAMMETAAHARLEEQDFKISEVREKVADLNAKIDALAAGPTNQDLFSRLNALNNNISDLEKELREVKAMQLALKTILEKILEANRRMLSRR